MSQFCLALFLFCQVNYSVAAIASYSIYHSTTLHTDCLFNDPERNLAYEELPWTVNAAKFIIFVENSKQLKNEKDCVEVKLLLNSPLPLPLLTEELCVSNYQPVQMDLPDLEEFKNTLVENVSMEAFSSVLFKNDTDLIPCIADETYESFSNCKIRQQVGTGTISIIAQNRNESRSPRDNAFIKVISCTFCYPKCTLAYSETRRESVYIWVLYVAFFIISFPIVLMGYTLKWVCEKED